MSKSFFFRFQQDQKKLEYIFPFTKTAVCKFILNFGSSLRINFNPLHYQMFKVKSKIRGIKVSKKYISHVLFIRKGLSCPNAL